jgi:hypothetical protein
MTVDLCDKCHPFYTGQQKLVDTGGRVQRFSDKFGGAAAAQLKKAKPSRKKRPQRQPRLLPPLRLRVRQRLLRRLSVPRSLPRSLRLRLQKLPHRRRRKPPALPSLRLPLSNPRYEAS